jgi:hypothetical protein
MWGQRAAPPPRRALDVGCVNTWRAYRLWRHKARLPDHRVDAKLGESGGRVVLVVNLLNRRVHALHHLAVIDAHLSRRHPETSG